MTDDILSNTGSHLMTAAYFNAQREMETEDAPSHTSPSAPVPPHDAPTNGEGAKTQAPTMDFDNDEGSLEDVARLVLGEVA